MAITTLTTGQSHSGSGHHTHPPSSRKQKAITSTESHSQARAKTHPLPFTVPPILSPPTENAPKPTQHRHPRTKQKRQNGSLHTIHDKKNKQDNSLAPFSQLTNQPTHPSSCPEIGLSSPLIRLTRIPSHLTKNEHTLAASHRIHSAPRLPSLLLAQHPRPVGSFYLRNAISKPEKKKRTKGIPEWFMRGGMYDMHKGAWHEHEHGIALIN